MMLHESESDCIAVSGSPCADLQSFVRVGSTLTTLFLVDEGREDPRTTISGPSSARQRNAINGVSLVCR